MLWCFFSISRIMPYLQSHRIMGLSQLSRHQRNNIVYLENDEGQQEDGGLSFTFSFITRGFLGFWDLM